MGERLNLVDRYDLACMKSDIEKDIIKMYNNDIYPLKKDIRIIKEQIKGLGEFTLTLGNIFDNIEHKQKNMENNILFCYIIFFFINFIFYIFYF